jgi:uncharacterized protein (DUF433 family)
MMPRRNQLKQPMEVGRYLIRHPKFYHGELTFKGTRIPVRTVLRHIAQGMSADEALENWPTLSHEALVEALSLATEALIERYGEAA